MGLSKRLELHYGSLQVGEGYDPLCQTSCRLNRIGTLGAQEDESGSIRTGVQRSDSSEAVATGEFFGGAGITRSGDKRGDVGALAGGCFSQWIWRRQPALDSGGTITSGDRHSSNG